MMAKVLKGTESFTAAYLDDIVIQSSSFPEHVMHLREVFTRLANANLVIRPDKCHLGDAQIPYLGHVVGANSMQPLRRKVEAVLAFPRPQTKKEVRSFLGLVGYYSRYVANFAHIAAPMSDLTRKNMPNHVKWTDSCERAFQTLKKALVVEPVLALPNFEDGFVLQVDASERGLGAILCQRKGEDENPVAFASRKLLPREMNLSTTEECLALVWAVEHFRPYLFGRDFIIETDHNALTWLNQVKSKNRKLLRWSLTLQEYDFQVIHKAGSRNRNADALSRI